MSIYSELVQAQLIRNVLHLNLHLPLENYSPYSNIVFSVYRRRQLELIHSNFSLMIETGLKPG